METTTLNGGESGSWLADAEETQPIPQLVFVDLRPEEITFTIPE